LLLTDKHYLQLRYYSKKIDISMSFQSLDKSHYEKLWFLIFYCHILFLSERGYVKWKR